MNVLPVPVTPLLGRERELEETVRLLGGTRLLTITGAGGSGKTRLALELAHRAAAQFSRVVWVDLAPIADGGLVAQQILNILGLRESPAFDDADLIIEALRGRSHLLILDNCEHVVDGCAVAAEKILRGSAGTSMIATTREALGIAGEQTWLVPPMSPDGATQLFVERARAVLPSFALDDSNRGVVAHICSRLDGIPLPIELAAARVKVLPVDQIAARLDDAFSLLSSGSRTLARHRTIRETIDWSFRLLSPAEQMLLGRLAVFAGGFSLAAAEAICGDEDVDVLQQLGALVDKSLVVAGGGRYRLLETVRQFAAEKLAQCGQRESTRERHALYYFHLVERSERRIYAGAVDLPTLAVIDEEIDNIRQALDWTEEDVSRLTTELRLLWALHWYWFARGHFHEARRRIVRALSRTTDDIDPLVRARAMVAAGNAAIWQADWKSLRPSADEAVEILRPSTNLRALANALLLVGCSHTFVSGDHERAAEFFREAEDVARRNGRNVALALTLFWAGIAATLRGDRGAARKAFEESHAIGLEQRNLPAIGHSATLIALADLDEKKYSDVIRMLSVAMDAHSETGDRWGLTQAVEGVGLTLLDIGDAEVGTKLIAGAEAAWLQLGARPGRTEMFEEHKDLRIRQALGNDRLRVVLASGAALDYQDLVTLAREELARLGGAQAPAPVAVASLSVKALGPLDIRRSGERVDGGSQSARARELLLFLLCNPTGATKEEIGAALWPDADAAKLRNNFHVTVHRLRKTLGGSGWVSAEGDVYVLDRSAGVEFDAESFERDVKAALRIGDTAALEQAVALYGGDFGQSSGAGEWHLPIRDRLRDLHAEALRVVGRAKMSAGDFKEAAAIYQKLIELDDLDEQAYRNLMTCLARSGDAPGAGRVYRRLSEILRKELDTEPDPATTRLYERISGTMNDER